MVWKAQAQKDEAEFEEAKEAHDTKKKSIDTEKGMVLARRTCMTSKEKAAFWGNLTLQYMAEYKIIDIDGYERDWDKDIGSMETFSARFKSGVLHTIEPSICKGEGDGG